MSKEDEPAELAVRAGRSRRVSGGVWVLGLAGLLLAYPLSLGPVGYVHARRGYLQEMEIPVRVYLRPMNWLVVQAPIIGGPLERWHGAGDRLGWEAAGFKSVNQRAP